MDDIDDPDKEKEHPKYKKYIIYVILFTIIFISIYCSFSLPNQIFQVGGMDMNAIPEIPKTPSVLASPISSTFGFVTSVIGKILKLIFLFFVIILIPTVPIVLYALAAYFMIRKFLGFFSS